jgi:DDE superfamily endonuclease
LFQFKYYSGKKKKHTVKTQYMVNSEGTILHKKGHDRGRIHDYEIFKNKHPATPPQVENILDLGYMGVQNDFPTVKYILPFRKKRKKSELSDEEKRYNGKHSKLRVIVEHTISRIKKLGIMGTKFRNKLKRYDHVSDVVSGLVNFRIMMRTNSGRILS